MSNQRYLAVVAYPLIFSCDPTTLTKLTYNNYPEFTTEFQGSQSRSWSRYKGRVSQQSPKAFKNRKTRNRKARAARKRNNKRSK